MHVYGLMFGFLVSGTLSTLACQLLIYHGAAETSSMLIPLFNYVGLMFSGFLTACQQRKRVSVPEIAEVNGLKSEETTVTRPTTVTPKPTEPGLPPRPRSRATPSGDNGAVPERKLKDFVPAGFGIAREEGIVKPRPRRASTSSQDIAKDAVSTSPVEVSVEPAETKAAPVQDKQPVQFGKLRFSENVFIVIVTALDLGGLILILLAIRFAGSGLFEVVYSSIVAWSAVLAWYFLGKRTSKVQLIGIAVVILGLAADTLGEMVNKHGAVPDAESVSLRDMFLGGIFSLAAALVYAFSFVVSEGVMSGPHPPNSKRIASRMGFIATGVCSIYVAAFTLPNWKSVVSEPIKEANGNVIVILATYGVMMVAQVVHIVMYFQIVGKVGAVTTGMLGGLRSALLFFVSALLFCSYQEAQCLTLSRALSACVVIGGVIVYSRGQATPPQQARKSLASADALATGDVDEEAATGESDELPAGTLPSAYRHSPLTVPDFAFLGTPRLY